MPNQSDYQIIVICITALAAMSVNVLNIYVQKLFLINIITYLYDQVIYVYNC